MEFYNIGLSSGAFSIGYARNPRLQFAVYAKGYFKIADAQADILLDQKNFRDYEVYPIIFLYRHCLELYLKSCIYNSATLSYILDRRRLDHSLINTHNLMILADKAKVVVQSLFPNDPDLENFCDLFYATAENFQKIDPTSFSFRYPINKLGSSCFECSSGLNLYGFQNRFFELNSGFEILDFGIDITTYQWAEIEKALDDLYPEEKELTNKFLLDS